MTDKTFCALETDTLSDMVETCTAARPPLECREVPRLPGFVGMVSSSCRGTVDQLNLVIEAFTSGRQKRRGQFSCSIEGFITVDSDCLTEVGLLTDAFNLYTRGPFAACKMTTSTTSSTSTVSSATTSIAPSTKPTTVPSPAAITVEVGFLFKTLDCATAVDEPSNRALLGGSLGASVGRTCSAVSLTCSITDINYRCGSVLASLSLQVSSQANNGVPPNTSMIVNLLKSAVAAGNVSATIRGPAPGNASGLLPRALLTAVVDHQFPYAEELVVAYRGKISSVAPDIATIRRLKAAMLAQLIAVSKLDAAMISKATLFSRDNIFGFTATVLLGTATTYIGSAPALRTLVEKNCTNALDFTFDGRWELKNAQNPDATSCTGMETTAAAGAATTTDSSVGQAQDGSDGEITDSILAIILICCLLLCLLCVGVVMLVYHNKQNDDPVQVHVPPGSTMLVNSSHNDMAPNYLDTHPQFNSSKLGRGIVSMDEYVAVQQPAAFHRGSGHYYPTHAQSNSSLLTQNSVLWGGGGDGSKINGNKSGSMKQLATSHGRSSRQGNHLQSANDEFDATTRMLLQTTKATDIDEYIDVARRSSAQYTSADGVDMYMRMGNTSMDNSQGMSPRRKSAELLFSAIDANNDGVVSFNEFKAAADQLAAIGHSGNHGKLRGNYMEQAEFLRRRSLQVGPRLAAQNTTYAPGHHADPRLAAQSFSRRMSQKNNGTHAAANLPVMQDEPGRQHATEGDRHELAASVHFANINQDHNGVIAWSEYGGAAVELDAHTTGGEGSAACGPPNEPTHFNNPMFQPTGQQHYPQQQAGQQHPGTVIYSAISPGADGPRALPSAVSDDQNMVLYSSLQQSETAPNNLVAPAPQASAKPNKGHNSTRISKDYQNAVAQGADLSGAADQTGGDLPSKNFSKAEAKAEAEKVKKAEKARRKSEKRASKKGAKEMNRQNSIRISKDHRTTWDTTSTASTASTASADAEDALDDTPVVAFQAFRVFAVDDIDADGLVCPKGSSMFVIADQDEKWVVNYRRPDRPGSHGEQHSVAKVRVATSQVGESNDATALEPDATRKAVSALPQ